MNHKHSLVRSLTIILLLLILAGCTAPKTLSLAEMNAWRINYNDMHVSARITFSPGDKCSLDILQPKQGSMPAAYPSYAYEIVVNDQTYQNYMVSALTMDEGQTLQDLEAFDKTAVGKVPPPSFSDLLSMEIVPPMSRTFHAVLMPDSPFYFVCIIQGPDNQRVIDEFGPVKVKQ